MLKSFIVLSLALPLAAAQFCYARVITVMPLGDSITNGYGSTDLGGYRPYLKSQVGANFEFVGRRSAGPIGSDKNEGWDGRTIRRLDSEVVAAAMAAANPDVITLMIGTNDAWKGSAADGDPMSAPQFMIPNLQHLLDDIYTAKPNVKVILSNLPRIYDWNQPPATADYQTVVDFNNQLPALVANQQLAGRSIYLVDSNSRLSINTDFADGLHPDDSGYQGVANAFYSGFVQAGLVPEPGAISLILLGIPLLRRRSRR